MTDFSPLSGKTALVTGAGRGLGRTFAEHLANLGCDVGVHGMREKGPAEYGEGTTLTDTARQIGEQAGTRPLRLLADLTQPDQIDQILTETEDQLGPTHILVHNACGDIAAAGGKPNPNDTVCIKEEDIRSVIDRNLLSTIFLCQRVARGMMERKAGRIITIGSIAAFIGRSDTKYLRRG